jgi:proteasome lid subunit RPN8/RPN11
MRIAPELVAEIVAHAREEAPNECCGMVASDGDRATRVFRARNKHASPLRFEINEQDQIRIFSELDAAGWEVGAIYHSHTRSAPYPSQTDVNMARWWPDPLWVIVGVADGEPEVRAFRIVDGAVEETHLDLG